MTLEENKERVLAQVSQACQSSGRPADAVQVIAVTKTVDSSIANQLYHMGLTHFGENRADKFLEKYHDLRANAITWHYIGSLQRRKVKDVINYIDYFHALDSLRLAEEIEKRALEPIKCFLQVNVSKESSKHGFLVEDLEAVLPQLAQLSKIQLVGLMTMAPLEASQEEISHIFQQTEALRQSIQKQAWPNMPMQELSMGMSQDFDLAIQAGATFVRIGTAFFK